MGAIQSSINQIIGTGAQLIGIGQLAEGTQLEKKKYAEAKESKAEAAYQHVLRRRAELTGHAKAYEAYEQINKDMAAGVYKNLGDVEGNRIIQSRLDEVRRLKAGLTSTADVAQPQARDPDYFGVLIKGAEMREKGATREETGEFLNKEFDKLISEDIKAEERSKESKAIYESVMREAADEAQAKLKKKQDSMAYARSFKGKGGDK